MQVKLLAYQCGGPYIGAKYGTGVKQYVRSYITLIRSVCAFLDGGPGFGKN